MVIGDGMIAKRFSSYATDEHLLVFASGVSNSSGATQSDYDREAGLLGNAIAANPTMLLIYFSTCSIYDPSLQDSKYVMHKLAMEQLIREQASSYTIFRVSNPVGITNNQHTVLNFFVQHIRDGSKLDVWQYASRNLIDLDDMFSLCDRILEEKLFRNATVNIANPVNYPVSLKWTLILIILNNILEKQEI